MFLISSVAFNHTIRECFWVPHFIPTHFSRETFCWLGKSFEAVEVDFLKVNNSKSRCCKSCCHLSKAAVIEADQWAKIQSNTLWWPNQSKPFPQLELYKDLEEASEMKPARGIFFLHSPVSWKGLSFLVQSVLSLLTKISSVLTNLDLVRDPWAAP